MKKETLIAVPRSLAPLVPVPALAAGVFDPLDPLVEWYAELGARGGAGGWAARGCKESSYRASSRSACTHTPTACTPTATASLTQGVAAWLQPGCSLSALGESGRASARAGLPYASPVHLPCISRASPVHLPCISQDRSEWLEQLLREEYGGGAGAEAQLLGKLQPSSNPSPSPSPSPNPSSPNPNLKPEPQAWPQPNLPT